MNQFGSDVWNNLQRYSLLFKTAKDIILFVRIDGKIVEANEAAVESYGYTYKELCNLKIYDLREKAAKTMSIHEMVQANEDGINFETIHKRKDGSIFRVEVSYQWSVIDGQIIFLSIIRDIGERKHTEEQIKYVVRHDYLTNIPNRFYLEEFIVNAFNHVHENQDALLIIDLNNFKLINDSFGHSQGDKVLIDIANCIKKKLRGSDFVARFGGDEFAVFLTNTDLNGALNVANKILTAINDEEYFIEGKNIKINLTASIGIIVIDETVDINLLFSYADAALSLAKNEGKNRVVILNEAGDKNMVLKNNKILTLIQDALEKDRFQIYLQPIYKTDDGVRYFEVLVRLYGENNNILEPDSFIPVAERYGLISLIDRWVIKSVINLIEKDEKLQVFINLSGESLRDDLLLEWIELIIKQRNVNPGKIGFEITETTAIKSLEKATAWINRLKALGCQFALDDFGVGFSSFTYLSTLPVDYLKIDGSFIRGLDSDSNKVALVRAMNIVAHTLGKKTIAEFVENKVIWEIVQELGTDYGQGYYLGKPFRVELTDIEYDIKQKIIVE